MAVYTNKSKNLTRDDSFSAKIDGHLSEPDSIQYANVIANNRIACQLEEVNTNVITATNRLAVSEDELKTIADSLEAVKDQLTIFNENFSFIRKVVESTWEGFHEKGWFAELMRKIAER